MSELTMRYFFEFKELITPQVKKKCGAIGLFLIWLFCFGFTVYEIATKGIW
jgi:hypothetical protein